MWICSYPTGTVSSSFDHGLSWETVGGVTTSNAVEILASGSDLYALTGAGSVWHSVDLGSTWLPIGTISQVHIGPNAAQQLAHQKQGIRDVQIDALLRTPSFPIQAPH